VPVAAPAPTTAAQVFLVFSLGSRRNHPCGRGHRAPGGERVQAGGSVRIQLPAIPISPVAGLQPTLSVRACQQRGKCVGENGCCAQPTCTVSGRGENDLECHGTGRTRAQNRRVESFSHRTGERDARASRARPPDGDDLGGKDDEYCGVYSRRDPDPARLGRILTVAQILLTLGPGHSGYRGPFSLFSGKVPMLQRSVFQVADAFSACSAVARAAEPDQLIALARRRTGLTGFGEALSWIRCRNSCAPASRKRI